MTSQVLDSMDLEREKGITIKARAVRLEYIARDGLTYGLNLIDTPGHVDFAYEVSRSLQACEGAILVVDATQGIEAQTLANVHLALREGLTLIPVLNKIDLPSADPDTIMDELENVLAIPREEVILASAKDGTGVAEILEAIVARIPAPKGDPAQPLQGLIFDCHYDAYKGVVVYVRLAQGTLRDDEPIRLMASGAEAEPARARRLPAAARARSRSSWPARSATSRPGSRTSARRRSATRSRRVAAPGRGAAARLPGGQEPRLRRHLPGQRRGLPAPARRAREAPPQRRQLHLRAGELGRARVRVPLRVPRPAPHGDRPGAPRARVRPRPHRVGAVGRVPRPADARPRHGRRRQPGQAAEPDPTSRRSRSRGSSSASSRRAATSARSWSCRPTAAATFMTMEYLDPTRVVLHFEMPLAELIVDYFDQLKSRSQGYASMDYEELGYRPANLVKVDILVNGEPVDALSLIVHRDRAQSTGRALTERLKQLIPRQMFEIPIQAAIGSNVIARETVRAMRKNVLAKCYGGDITRKRKLLEKQKEGKQRMKRVGFGRDPAGGVPGDAPDGRGLGTGPDGRLRPARRSLIALGLALLLVMLRARRRAVRRRPSTTRRRATASGRGSAAGSRGTGSGVADRGRASCSSTRRRSATCTSASGDRLGAVVRRARSTALLGIAHGARLRLRTATTGSASRTRGRTRARCSTRPPPRSSTRSRSAAPCSACCSSAGVDPTARDPRSRPSSTRWRPASARPAGTATCSS